MEHIVSSLLAKLRKGQDSDVPAAEMAARAIALWHQVVTPFAQIIGPRGATALLRRALVLTATRHPWLTQAVTAAPSGQDLSSLAAAFERRPAADVSAANEALLRNFFDLLASLIGAALTQRLLREALDPPASGVEPQETSK
jgi:hypothetical protein